jgi:cytochrome oxidase assembly protein ShyY1
MHAQWMIKHECLCRLGCWRRGREEEKKKRLVELETNTSNPAIPQPTEDKVPSTAHALREGDAER